MAIQGKGWDIMSYYPSILLVGLCIMQTNFFVLQLISKHTLQYSRMSSCKAYHDGAQSTISSAQGQLTTRPPVLQIILLCTNAKNIN